MEKGRSAMIMEAVVDSSVVASWFLPDEKGGAYDVLLDIIDRVKLFVPPIFIYEFFNILIMAEKRGRLSRPLQTKILQTVEKLPIFIEPLLPGIQQNHELMEMAQKFNLTSYDAAYFNVAVKLGYLPVLTYDKQMLAAAVKFKFKTHV